MVCKPSRACGQTGDRWIPISRLALPADTFPINSFPRRYGQVMGAPPGIRTRNLRIKSPLLCH
jgi:hypothetical protein